MRKTLAGTSSLLISLVVALGTTTTAPGCGSDEATGDDGGGSSGSSGDAGCGGFGCTQNDGGKPGCVGLQCQQVECEGGGTTKLTGTVLDPAGKVPIFNATVYVPNKEPDAIKEGATSCDRCDPVTGSPVVVTATNTEGKFELSNMPVGENIPLVIQIGKWRRKVTIPSVPKCASTAADAALTRLPKNRGEGNIPRMALTTGGADPLQCLLRKIGIDDSEFGVAGSDARIHLYKGSGYNDGADHPPSGAFNGSVSGGAAFPAAASLWSDKANLQKYDVVLLSCEGGENEAAAGAEKAQVAKDAMYDYAAGGGRIFASHYHYVWFSKTTNATVKGVASWSVPEKAPPAVPAVPRETAVKSDISAAFPKAVAMNEWLTKQNALEAGKLPIYDARHDIDGVNASALSWITAPKSSTLPAGTANPVQYMSFNTPIGAAEDKVCGRVVVSDIHVAAQAGNPDNPAAAFPDGCVSTELTAQQKALEFMLFDLSSCVQKDDDAITPPR